jgi:hypothetical protein
MAAMTSCYKPNLPSTLEGLYLLWESEFEQARTLISTT